MRVIYGNFVDDLTSITASNENSEYPVTNLPDPRLTTLYKSTGNSVTISMEGTKIPITPLAIALLGHNLSSSATITFQISEDVDFLTTIDETLTWNEGIILKFLDYSGSISESSDYKYYRIVISDPLNSDGYIGLSRIYLSGYLNITPSRLLDFSVTVRTSDRNIYSIHRDKFAIEGKTWRVFDLRFPASDKDMINSVSDFIDTVGLHTSFIFCNFDSIRDYPIVEPCYCSISNDVEFTHKDYMRMSYNLSLEEDL